MNFSRTIGFFPDKFIIKEFPDIGITVNGRQLREASSRCAAWLQKQGIRTIGIHMGNCPEFLYLLTGALRAGVKTELFNALKPAESALLVFDRESVQQILQETEEGRFAEYIWDLNEPIIVIPTSGTSGERKIVEKSIRNIFGEKGFHPLIRTALKLTHFRIYNVSPWYHNSGIKLLLMSLAGCAFTEITTYKYNPESMRQYLNITRPGFLLCTPTMLLRCASCGEVFLPPWIICSGERMPTDTIRLLEEKSGGGFLCNIYGTTETGGISNLTYTYGALKPGVRIILSFFHRLGIIGAVYKKTTLPDNCVGTICKGVTVKIVKDGIEQQEGATGTITVSKKTKIDSIKSEFFDTGDVGYIKDNLLFIAGRNSYTINRSGEKILPGEIERVIEGFNGVEAVAVFAVSSATHGEDICAVVKSKDGTALFEIKDLKEKLPKFMLPQYLCFLKEFPVNGSGKTDIAALKTQMEIRFGQAQKRHENPYRD